jgi:putative flippase GtrA
MTARIPAFIGVAAIGFTLQIGVLVWLSTFWHWPYPVATALAVEAAVLHNFLWHERWTWRDRPAPRLAVPGRLLRYHLGTGLVSLIGNLIVTAAAVELLHLPTLASNVCAVVATSVANFLIADRWVFSPPMTTSFVALLLLIPRDGAAAELRPDTIAAWNRHVAAVEVRLREHEADSVPAVPSGRAVAVPGGTIHEWRGSVLIEGVTVSALVQALESPGLPPPTDDILDARVMSRNANGLHLYLKLARTALITVTYDTEHDVTFVRTSPSLATSRSVSTSIREEGGSDRGFLWRLNSYWRYRQHGNDVMVDVLSVSLSRAVPALARPIAGPLIDRVARESMWRTLDAVDRFGRRLRTCRPACERGVAVRLQQRSGARRANVDAGRIQAGANPRRHRGGARCVAVNA